MWIKCIAIYISIHSMLKISTIQSFDDLVRAYSFFFAKVWATLLPHALQVRIYYSASMILLWIKYRAVYINTQFSENLHHSLLWWSSLSHLWILVLWSQFLVQTILFDTLLMLPPPSTDEGKEIFFESATITRPSWFRLQRGTNG